MADNTIPPIKGSHGISTSRKNCAPQNNNGKNQNGGQKVPLTKKPSFTIYAGSTSDQNSYSANRTTEKLGKEGEGGLFTNAFTNGLKQGKSHQDSINPLKNENIADDLGGPLSGYPHQHMIQYGPDVPSSLNKGVAIILRGAPENRHDTYNFDKDISNLEESYKKRSFKVLKASNWDEFTSRLKEARELGEKGPGDLLHVHYSGHGSLQSKENTPELEGLIELKSSKRGDKIRDYVHERDLLSSIAATGKSFDHTLLTLDSCHSGAIDPSSIEQTTQIGERIKKIDKSTVLPPPLEDSDYEE